MAVFPACHQLKKFGVNCLGVISETCFRSVQTGPVGHFVGWAGLEPTTLRTGY